MLELFPALDAVVDVGVAGGAKGFVVEAGGAGSLVQLVGEVVDGAEVVGGGGDLKATGLEEFLVAAIEDAGDLSAEQIAGPSDEQDVAVAGGGGRYVGGATVFPDLNGPGSALCTLMGGSYIKTLAAQKGQDIVEAALLCLLCHTLDSKLTVAHPEVSIKWKTGNAVKVSWNRMIATERSLGTSILERIGNTPLVRLERLTEDLPGVTILGKAEWANPGGSVKDRAASAIVTDGMRRGLIGHGRGLLDATSGNTGIAYAMLGSAMQFPVTLCMPSNVSVERKRYLAAYGAEIIWTDPADGSDGAIRKAREMVAAEPDRYFYADQYSNDENWKAHYRTTGNEIWGQTEGQVTDFVAALGTSGTFMGTTRRLRELNPRIRCYSMQPDSPFNGLEGLKHMATAIVPRIYDPTLADENIEMATETAYAMVKHLGKNQGLLVGVSAAAAVAAAMQVGRKAVAEGREAVIVTILCDSAAKYMSERFWTEE